jgi:hypothetical protein
LTDFRRAIPTMRTTAFRSTVDFYNIVTFMKTMLYTEFTIKCVFCTLFSLAATQAHIIIETLRHSIESRTYSTYIFSDCRIFRSKVTGCCCGQGNRITIDGS